MSYLEFTPGADAAFIAALHEQRVVEVAEKIPLRFVEQEFTRAYDDYIFLPAGS